MKSRLSLALLVTITGCGSGRSTHCGIAALAAPGLLLEEFTRPGRTLSQPPQELPPVLPVRLAVGNALRGLVGKSDSGWIIGAEGTIPTTMKPGFGVLVLDPSAQAQGVVLYEGPPVPGATELGRVNLGSSTVPLIGLKAAVDGFQDPRCPLFPDSLRR